MADGVAPSPLMLLAMLLEMMLPKRHMGSVRTHALNHRANFNVRQKRFDIKAGIQSGDDTTMPMVSHNRPVRMLNR